MADAGRSGRLAENAALLQQKRLITDQVRLRFARFGDDVLAIILGYALQPKRMPILLQKFNIRSFPDLDNQLGALWSYISEHGAREFIKRLKVEKREEVKPIEVGSGGIDPAAMPVQELIARMLVEVSAQMQSPAVEPPKVINVPGYSGPERRTGIDRRTGRDRRGDIAAIRKNKRYGGDRRKRPRGRRRSDIVK